jgi:ATP synthase protein I
MNNQEPSETSPAAPVAEKKPKPGFNFLMMGSGQMFTAMIISGFIVGYFIDYLLGTTPILMMICGVLGMIGGVQKVQHMVNRMDKQPSKDINNG